MSYIIDTSLGLILAILMLGWLDQVANARHWTALKDSGVYTGQSATCHWMAQVTAWLVILTITKLIICAFMWICSAPLAAIGGLLFAPLQGNIRFELVFVMILFPGLLNVIYFWIADSFLKAKKEHAAAHEPQDGDDDHTTMTQGSKTEALIEHHQPEVLSMAPWWSSFAPGHTEEKSVVVPWWSAFAPNKNDNAAQEPSDEAVPARVV